MMYRPLILHLMEKPCAKDRVLFERAGEWVPSTKLIMLRLRRNRSNPLRWLSTMLSSKICNLSLVLRLLLSKGRVLRWSHMIPGKITTSQIWMILLSFRAIPILVLDTWNTSILAWIQPESPRWLPRVNLFLMWALTSCFYKMMPKTLTPQELIHLSRFATKKPNRVSTKYHR